MSVGVIVGIADNRANVAAGNPQTFKYTVLGTETSHFTIGSAQGLNARNDPPDYQVIATFEDPNGTAKTFTYSIDSKTSTSFKIRTSAQVNANMIITFTVKDYQ